MTGVDNNAVSSVVGTVLILAITVTTFTGLSVVVLDAVEEAQAAPRANIRIEQRGLQIMLTHAGGDVIDPAQTTVVVYSQGVRTAYDLSTIDLDGHWGPGETICIPCIHGDADGVELIVRHGGSSVLAGAGTTGGSGQAGGGSADLSAPKAHADLFNAGSSSRFRATVSNSGLGDATAFGVRFSIDGTQLGATKNVAALAAGQTIFVESDPWIAVAGTHRVVILVDPQAAVPESDEGNNRKVATFIVSSQAGTQGFHDVDADAGYTLGTDVAVTVGALTAAECTGRPCQAGDVGIVVPTASGAGLVIPDTSMPLASAELIYLEAPGNIIVAVALTATGDDAIHVVSTNGYVSLPGQDIATSKSLIAVGAATGIDVTRARLVTEGNGGAIQLATASGDIVADAAALIANQIDVVAPTDPDGAIWQEGLHLCITWSTASDACKKAHVAGSGPSEYAANVQGSTLLGTRAEGAWVA